MIPTLTPMLAVLLPMTLTLIPMPAVLLPTSPMLILMPAAATLLLTPTRIPTSRADKPPAAAG